MENEDQEDIKQVLPSDTNSDEVEAEVEAEADTSEQDPLKTELEKVQRQGRTKAEKLIYTKKRIDSQLKELGIEDEPIDDEDDTPVTVGMLKKLQSQSATKTALDLADGVTNETERELLKYHLENTIKSTGDPNKDFDLARTLINAVKNRQIMEESNRKSNPKTHSSASGAPAKVKNQQDDLSQEEMAFMQPPFNLTKEQVLKARPQ